LNAEKFEQAKVEAAVAVGAANAPTISPTVKTRRFAKHTQIIDN
jgi:hypothetical protein